MKTTGLTLTLALSLVVAAFSPAAAAQTINYAPPQPPAITVTGNGQVEAAPDQAIVRIGILRQSTSAKDAQEDAGKIGADILKAFAALSIPAQRIQTSRLTISPIFSQQRQGGGEAPRVTGYMASNSVTVTLDNLAQIGPVVDAGLDNGANQLEGVQFRLKNDGPVREQALRLAVAEAKGKAAAMADALMVTMGPLLEVSESGVSVGPLEERFEGTIGALATRAATPTPVSPGQLVINANVVLKYSIISKN